MKLLSILFSVFIIALLLGTKIIQENGTGFFPVIWDGCIYYFTGFSHFKFQKGMALMIPDFIPYKMFWVYFTGVLEIAAGIGLMIPQLRENNSNSAYCFLCCCIYSQY